MENRETLSQLSGRSKSLPEIKQVECFTPASTTREHSKAKVSLSEVGFVKPNFVYVLDVSFSMLI